jgi:hypothetical protein
MGRQRVIYHVLSLNQPAQKLHFEIKLPPNTKKVLAVDYDVFIGLDTQNYNTSDKEQMGRLKLQGHGTGKAFYSEQIWAVIIYINLFIEQPYPFGGLAWTYPTNPKKVYVPENTKIIKGLFEDRVNKELMNTVPYDIRLAIWIETDENPKGFDYEFLKE